MVVSLILRGSSNAQMENIQREVEKAIKEEKEKKLAEERKKMDEITNKYKASSRLDKLKEKNNIK
jgi:hypothetical protein